MNIKNDIFLLSWLNIYNS